MSDIEETAPSHVESYETDDEKFDDLFQQAKLRKTWNAVRKELRYSTYRDSIDWLDWVIQIDNTLSDIRKDILDGKYQPLPPTRYELGKSKGSFRYMTTPNVKDGLVYRHLSDEVLRLATPNSIKGAYFSRRHTATPVGSFGVSGDVTYDHFFEVWLRYNEYRAKTLLNEVYQVLVVTDISNYFVLATNRPVRF